MKRPPLAILALPLALLVGCDTDEPETEQAAALEATDDAHSGRAHGFIAKLDVDGDGAISREEAEGHFLAKKFDKLDANGDGLLTADELAAMKKRGGKGKWKHRDKDPQARAERIMAKLDADSSGSISRDEAEGHFLAKKFDALDADGDGLLTLDELAAMKGHHKKRGKHGKRHKDPSVHAERKMSKLDADGDGVLSRAEVEGTRLEEKFTAIDADGDGKITKEELADYKRAKHEKRQGSAEGPRAG
jgi:Ca2+-binding EF-hand superfamily protein